MLRILLLIIFIFSSSLSFSQLSDFIVVKKKNGRTIEAFIAGKAIEFKTNTGALINGQILDIQNDSIFVMTYNIRTVPTNLGVTIVDTISKTILLQTTKIFPVLKCITNLKVREEIYWDHF